MHYNIQIMVQQVGVEGETDAQAAERARRRGVNPVPARKVTIEVLNLKVVAPTEEAAFERAARLLEASKPQVPSGQYEGEFRHLDLDLDEEEEG